MKKLSVFLIFSCFLINHIAQASVEQREVTVALAVTFFNAAATQPDPEDATQDILHLYNQEVDQGLIQQKKIDGRFYYEAISGKENVLLTGISRETVGYICNWEEQGAPTLEGGFTTEEIQQCISSGVYRFYQKEGETLMEQDPSNPHPHFYILEKDQGDKMTEDLSHRNYTIVVRSDDPKSKNIKDKEDHSNPIATPISQDPRILSEKRATNPSEDFLWELVGLGEDLLVAAFIVAVIYYGPFIILNAMGSDAGLPVLRACLERLTGRSIADYSILTRLSEMTGNLSDFWRKVGRCFDFCRAPSYWTRFTRWLGF